MELTGWDGAATLAKAITYAATLGAAGAIFFLNYGESLLRTPQRRRIQRRIALLLIAAALASVAKVLLMAGSMSDDVAGMLDSSYAGMILRAGEGRAISIRMVGLVVCGIALFLKRPWNRLAALGALIAAGSFAAVGHVYALKPNGAASLLLALHLCCAAFWLGALAPLLQVARDGDDVQTAALAARFGKLALGVVATLIAAGTVLLCRLLGGVSELWTDAYGRLLSLKLVLVASLLSAAALNKLRLTPRLAAGDAQAGLQLRRSIGMEMILGGLILLATAALTTLTGPTG